MDVDFLKNKKCFKCGRPGHRAKECRTVHAVEGQNSGNQVKNKKTKNKLILIIHKITMNEIGVLSVRSHVCWECGKMGHIKKNYNQEN